MSEDLSRIKTGVAITLVSSAILTLCTIVSSPLWRVLRPLFKRQMSLEEMALLIAMAWCFIGLLLLGFLALLIWLLFERRAVIKCMRRLSELEGKAVPEVVIGKGYCIDRRNGEPICPRCWAEGITSYLRPYKHGGRIVPHTLYCNACLHGISTDTEADAAGQR